MSEETPTVARTNSFMVAIIFIAFALSFFALYQAMVAYVNQNPESGNSLLIMSLTGFALSTYFMLQAQRGAPKLILKPQRVATTILCEKCGFKNVREFQRGDYILKETENCPKCNEKTLITSIHREVEGSESEE